MTSNEPVLIFEDFETGLKFAYICTFCILLSLEITEFHIQFFDLGFKVVMSKIRQLGYSSLKGTETFRDVGKNLIYAPDFITSPENL